MSEPGAYEVGYGKPPKNARFAKGQSGNPRGRPRGSKNLSTILEQALSERVTVNVNGKRRKISKLEAAVTQLVNKAAGGEHRALAQLLPQLQALELRSTLPGATPVLGEDDRAVMASIMARLQGKREASDGV